MQDANQHTENQDRSLCQLRGFVLANSYKKNAGLLLQSLNSIPEVSSFSKTDVSVAPVSRTRSGSVTAMTNATPMAEAVSTADPIAVDDSAVDEMNRLDMCHAVMVKTIGNRLFLAPVDEAKTQRILDIGTGTGIWAMEMGDLFPNAQVLGNDLSAIQPDWVPPNVKFEIDDVESPWVQDRKYDFIFCRYMNGSLADWPTFMKRVYENLNPGGWAEFQDWNFMLCSDDGSIEGSETLRWSHLFHEAAKVYGRESQVGPKLEALVQENTGLVNIHHKPYKIPVGPWAKDPHLKDLGMCNLIQLLDGLEGFSLRLLCGALGWTKEEVLVLLAGVRKELKSGKLHGYLKYDVVYGQKPEED
ncbi:putative methyltransferase domain-containing protein [Colletotrichum sublineola]|uniref:Putative methyltransferase domain-containing protein n=1 Tax=Colletotrichum sublineola TaxID=1173701 RepID=A0A066X4P2_COLSU|nr:putative methyltransferase domain-containing protein [Colletotrichum sublineola]